MRPYHVLVFFHVLGAIGIFVALGIESVSLRRLRTASALVDARAWADVHALPGRLGAISMACAIAAGIGLMRYGWGRQPWILTAIVGLLAMISIGAVVSLRGARRLRRALADETGPGLSESFRSLRAALPMTPSLWLRIALGIGILGLMTLKPGATEAWRILIAAALSGVAAVIPFAICRSRPKPKRIAAGALFGRRELTAISGQTVAIPDADRLVHVQFRRFAGCPVCNLHLQSFVRRHRELEAAGIREVVVFHSTTEDLRAHANHFPFAVIADPGKHLYVELEVESAPRALLDPRAWGAIARGVVRSAFAIVRRRELPPALRPHGGRFGLPADFLVGRDGKVIASKYGDHADDQWSVDDLLRLARESFEPSSLA